MTLRTIVLSAFLAALWLAGLVDQFHSSEAAMRYLVLSMAIVAICLCRRQPLPALMRRKADQPRRPPE